MPRHGEERISTILGFDPLPETFGSGHIYEGKDRDVVCHASAWDPDFKDDLRIKMCIRSATRTCHIHLTRPTYYREYKNQPFLFENGANDSFHEAIGTCMAPLNHPECGADRPAGYA